MRATVHGTTMPVLEVHLAQGESVFAESGQYAWLSPNVDVHTAAMGMSGADDMVGAVMRTFGGGTFFMTRFTGTEEPGNVVFALKNPGVFKHVKVEPGSSFMLHRHGFICADEGVVLQTGLQRKLGVGLFGGAGFVMQRLTGRGDAMVQFGGEVFPQHLKAGQSVRVHPGHLGMYEEHMQLEFDHIKGIRNKLFGDGLFLARLHGPGTVWLQSFTLAALAHSLEPYMHTEHTNGNGLGSAAGAIGGLVGGLLSD
ncbi:MAG: AIM24 family protein [Thermoleophilia bacterium]